VLLLRQHPRDCIRWQEIALSAARRFQVRSREEILLNTLGVAYSDLGEVARAIECHEQALAIAREIGDQSSQSNALGNLGVAFSDLGDMRRAITYYEQQLTIMRDIGERRAEARTKRNARLNSISNNWLLSVKQATGAPRHSPFQHESGAGSTQQTRRGHPSC
jgi:tetratricopeptide (TPR) repeat protein